MLFPYAPLPPPLDLAGTKRNLPFLLELAKRNEVSVLSFGTPEQEQMFRKSYGELCQEIRFINRKRPLILNALELAGLLCRGRSSLGRLYRLSMQRAIKEMTSARKYDVIHCCTQMFGFFKFPTGIPVSGDAHDVMYDHLLRTARTTTNPIWKVRAYLDYVFGKKEEINICRKFNLLTTTTERDCELFKKALPNQKFAVVQNGVGNTFFKELHIQPEPFTLAFTGLFTHVPNTQGMLWFLKDIFPLILKQEPSARVYIVGKNPPRSLLSKDSENIIVTGFVNDVRPYIARSQAFIIPLQAGGGIRGKALEAMAMRRPIVTTTIGVEGIKLIKEHSALFGDTPEEFARAVIRLFREPGLRQRIASNAFDTVVKEYNWETKGRELECCLRALIESQKKKQ